LQTQFSPPASAAPDHRASAAPLISVNPRLIGLSNYFAFNILKSNRRSSLSQDRFRAAIGGLDRLLNLLRIPQR
jgi:hypothetical protein